MNKYIFYAIAFSLGCFLANMNRARAQDVYIVGVNKTTKLGAVRALINDKDAKVLRCYQVELTDKITLRKIKTTNKRK